MIIGVCGYKGSGKSSFVREVLKQVGDVKGIALADPIRDICHLLFGFSYEEMEDPLLKEAPDLNRPLPEGSPHLALGHTHLSPRLAMQHVGSALRTLQNDVWVQHCLRRAWELQAQGYKHVFITDVRYHNEANAIRCADGIIVKKLEAPWVGPPGGAFSQHESERDIGHIFGEYVSPWCTTPEGLSVEVGKFLRWLEACT